MSLNPLIARSIGAVATHVNERRNTDPIDLLRRSLDVAADKDKTVKVSGVGMLILAITILAYGVFLAAYSYSILTLIPTLCAIESPETSVYVPVNSLQNDQDEPPAYGDEDNLNQSHDEDVTLTKSKPYTVSIRATLRHLRSKGGFWAPIRGAGLYIVLIILGSILTSILSAFTTNLLIVGLASVISQVLLANLHVTWIHVVISEPSSKRWWSRLPRPALQTWVKSAPAVAVYALATQFVSFVPIFVTGRWNTRDWYDKHATHDTKHMYTVLALIFSTILLFIILFVLLVIPAVVTFVRVAASMLPEEDETIVPFDRTYGGKVTPAIVGGQGKVGMLEAWRSFPWASRKRLLWLCAKAMMYVILAEVVFTVIIALEAQFLIGPGGFDELSRAFAGIGRQ